MNLKIWKPGQEDRDSAFDQTLREAGLTAPRREALATLQINLGKRCNQACLHCHVDAGPNRTEMMSEDVLEQVLALAADEPGLHTIDITGGAPELHPAFMDLVVRANELVPCVIDRCNLTILQEPGMEALGEFLAAQRVHLIASLPCYGADNVDKQRGRGVFERSLRSLRELNALGYGMPESGLSLDLVYNPGGPFLPPSQPVLEQQYRRELRTLGIEFNRLLTLANMPIERFARSLQRDGALDDYMELLVRSFNPGTVSALMCRAQVSVSYDGRLYDCDFNQMVALPLSGSEKHTSVFDIARLSDVLHQPIGTGAHCLGCTAGAGSSCGGALQ